MNTINIPGAIVLYGVALLQRLQRANPKTKLGIAPVQEDGIWCLELSYQGDEPAVPDTWHGQRVILRSLHRRVPDFGRQNKVREVLATLGERGREALRRHGYDVGDGFVDVLSQYQTLEHAARTERLRDLEGLLGELNAPG